MLLFPASLSSIGLNPTTATRPRIHDRLPMTTQASVMVNATSAQATFYAQLGKGCVLFFVGCRSPSKKKPRLNHSPNQPCQIRKWPALAFLAFASLPSQLAVVLPLKESQGLTTIWARCIKFRKWPQAALLTLLCLPFQLAVVLLLKGSQSLITT